MVESGVPNSCTAAAVSPINAETFSSLDSESCVSFNALRVFLESSATLKQ